LLDLMVILVLSVHLLAMNLASAGPLFGIWLGRRGESNDPGWENLGQTLASISFWSLLLGMFTGGVQLAFAPAAGFWDALARLPNRALWFAGAELVFSLACLLLYAGCWTSLRKHRWWHASLALLSSSNLFYHFPPLMSVLGKLAKDSTWAKPPVLDRSALLPLMMRNEVLALSSHFFLASLAVAAIAVLWLASKTNNGDEEKSTSLSTSILPLSRRAAWAALIVTAMQIPVGSWLLVSLPPSARASMMGYSAIASLAFVGALLLTFLLLQRLLTIAIGTVEPRDLRQASWILVVLVLLMTATLYESRHPRQPLRTDSVDASPSVVDTSPRKVGAIQTITYWYNDTGSQRVLHKN